MHHLKIIFFGIFEKSDQNANLFQKSLNKTDRKNLEVWANKPRGFEVQKSRKTSRFSRSRNLEVYTLYGSMFLWSWKAKDTSKDHFWSIKKKFRSENLRVFEAICSVSNIDYRVDSNSWQNPNHSFLCFNFRLSSPKWTHEPANTNRWSHSDPTTLADLHRIHGFQFFGPQFNQPF